MILSEDEQQMLEGRFGPGVQKSMEVLVKFGTAFDAESLVKIASAHVIPTIPIELLEEMTEGIATPAVFTTLHPHMSAFSPEAWDEMGISPEYAARNLDSIERRKRIFREKGFFQTYTCFPATVGSLPKKGDYISWIGSGGQVLVNSVIGARCNRDGALVTLAAAITGRAPYRGLFLDKERLARIHVTLKGIDAGSLTQTELSAIGYYLGHRAQDRNIAIEGIPKDFGLEKLRYLMVPLTVTGAVGVCHVVGLTPEADTLEEAFGNRQPQKTIVIDREVIAKSLELYAPDPVQCGTVATESSTSRTNVDMVVFGCPHLTISEVQSVADLLQGRKLDSGTFLWVGLSYQQYELAQEMGYVQTIEKAGGRFASACMSMVPEPPIPDRVKVIRTQSFKAAHYITRLTKGRVKVEVVEMEDCISALVSSAPKVIAV